MKSIAVHVAVLLMLASLAFAADYRGPIKVQCGGQFLPAVEAVEGKVGPTSIGQLMGAGGVPAMIPTTGAGQIAIYQQFCQQSDKALVATCEKTNRDLAVQKAVENCRASATAKGNDANSYVCMRDSCAPGQTGCTKHSTSTSCAVAVPKLECSCSVSKAFDQPPPVSTSTVSCMCECTCKASGHAEMQCTNCDGTCVEPGPTGN